jgi:hypothetical protein
MGLTKPRAYQIFDIDYKQAVRVITLTNVTLAGGAPSTVDGVGLSIGSRILVAGQSTGSQNGVYQVSVLGTGSNGTWIRSVDTNESGELNAGTIVMVTEGVTYKDTQWKLTTNDPIVIGTTALVFEQNSAFAFGNIYANSTAVLADIVGDTVTFTPANNMVILANATSDTIAFEVSQSPSFTGAVSVTGNITGGNLVTAGTANINTLAVTGLTTLGGNTTVSGHLLPSANITYDIGSPTQRWRSLYVGANTIDIGGATISANLVTGSLIMTGPDGAEFILSGTSITNSLGTFGFVEIGSNTNATSTTSGALQVLGGVGVTGNIYAGGQTVVTGNVNAGNVYTAGTVTGSLLTGTLTTAAQPNITSLGTLSGLSISGNLGVTGNVAITGNINYSNVTDLVVGDPLIFLGANNTSNVVDLGFIVTYDDGVDQHGGWVRDASDGTWKLFGNVVPEPTTTVNFTNAIYQPLLSGAITSIGAVSAAGNIIGANITSNALVSTVTLSATGNANVGNLNTAGQVTATGNITGGNLVTGSQVVATGNVTGSNIVTAGQVSATGNVSGSTLIASGNIITQSRQQVKFYDTDNSNFISLRAPNALTGDYLLTLPTGYGNADQVLSTNGAGGLTWVDQSGGGGGGSATSFPNSTVSPVPGSTGNFDLSFNFVQTSQETPFESGATDPFGVNLGEVYSMMDPGGEILEPVDLGVLT